MLEKISGFTVEEAKKYLHQASVEADVHPRDGRQGQGGRGPVQGRGRQSGPGDHRHWPSSAAPPTTPSETTVSVVPLPNDEMKGRIIGREGRNIRTIETAHRRAISSSTTRRRPSPSPASIPVRREIARLALEKLIQDGRIHPARIEEMVEKAQREVDADHQGRGRARRVRDERPRPAPRARQAARPPCATAPATARTCSTTPSRSSHLAGLLAAELGVDVALAKRAGLLHDLGKSIDHEVEGSHVHHRRRPGPEVQGVRRASSTPSKRTTATWSRTPSSPASCRPPTPSPPPVPARAARTSRTMSSVSKSWRKSPRSFPGIAKLLCHSGRPRDAHHGQARRGQRGSDRPARARHRQEDRSRA